MAQDIPVLTREENKEQTKILTKTLKSLDRTLESLNIKQAGLSTKKEIDSKRNIEGFERANINDLQREAFKSLIGPLRLITDPMGKFFGIDLQKATGGLLKNATKSLVSAITGINDEERKTINLKKQMEKEKYKELLRESKENERLIKVAHINKKEFRDTSGKFIATEGWSNIEKQRWLLGQSGNVKKIQKRQDVIENKATYGTDIKMSKLLGVDYRAEQTGLRTKAFDTEKQKAKTIESLNKLKNQDVFSKGIGKNLPAFETKNSDSLFKKGDAGLAEKDPLIKERKKFKVTTSPSKTELSRTEAGQAILWQSEESRKLSKLGKGQEGGGLINSLLGGLLGGGLAGGALSKILPILSKIGPIAAIAGSILWLGMDAVTGYLKSEKWGVSKLSGAIGGLLGGAGSGIKGAIKGAGKGALVGGTIGMVGGPVGIVVGALIGAAISSLLSYIGGEEIAKGKLGFDLGATIQMLFSKLFIFIQDYIQYKFTSGLSGKTFEQFTTEQNKSREKEVINYKADVYQKLRIKESEKAISAMKPGTEKKRQEEGLAAIKLQADSKIADFASSKGQDARFMGALANGGLIKTPGFLLGGEKEPEIVIPKSKFANVVHGFNNPEVTNMFNDIKKETIIKSENYGKEIVDAVNRLSEIVNNKPFNNIINTIDSAFNSDKVRTAHVYGVS